MLSIIYITCRLNCKFEYFFESLMKFYPKHLSKSEIQIIIVDGLLDSQNIDLEERRSYFSEIIQNQIDFLHVPPKPTPWQGKYRLTTDDYFTACNSRNTGICYVKYNYVAFIDDLGCPGPNWMETVLDAQKQNIIQVGAYNKSCNIIYKEGEIISKTVFENGIDCRLSVYNEDFSKAYSSHFFGSSFCLPLNVYLDINGMNEKCSGMGGEDTDFGIRLIRNGHIFYYNKKMFVDESDELLDNEKTCKRCDPKKNKNDPKSNLSHYLLNEANNGDIIVNPEFFLYDYHRRIVINGEDPSTVFIKPTDKIHFFTGKLISCGFSDE